MERMTASVMGAKFDREREAWYVPEGLLLHLFRHWIPSFIAAKREHDRTHRIQSWSVQLSPEEGMRLYAQGAVSLRTLKRCHGIVGCDCATRCLKL
jgi:hypothetical protein